MSKYEWERNAEYKKLPTIESGDIVHLKTSTAFIYSVKAIVTQVNNSEIKAIVEAVFDWNEGEQITGGEVAQLVGNELNFKQDMVYRVIKSNSSMGGD